MRPFPQKTYVLSLLLASLLLWLICLGNSPLRDWDEGTVAQVAREIWRVPIASLHWLYPTLAGEPYHNKPPLMHWLIALSYSLGGVNEWTTRLPGAMLTALGVPLLYLVGCLLFNESLPALFAALVYLTTLPVVRHGRLAMLDGTSITFFLLLLFCLLKARHQKPWALGVGFCLGIITLTKGMLVLLLGGIAAIFVLISSPLAVFFNLYFWGGILLGIAPAIAWYLAQWQYYGSNFLEVNLQEQTFARLGKSVEGNTGLPWYYLIELLKYSFPWLLFCPEGLHLAWKKRHTSWGNLVLIGTTVYLGTISFMTTKLPWYVMPIYPFLALAIGAKLHEFWQQTHFRVRIWGYFLFLFALAGLGGCIYFAIADYQPILIAMSIIVVITMSISAWLVLQSDRRFIPVLFTGMYLTLLLLMSSKSWIWELNESFAVKPVATLISKYVSPGTTIYTSFAYSRPSLNFYCDCKVVPINSTESSQIELQQSYLLLDEISIKKIEPIGGQRLGKAEGFTLIAPVSN